MYDDGLQLISQKERSERKQFYKKHNIGYVARPGAGRRGRFKKASNLNFGMNLGLEIERRVATGQGKISYKAAMKQLREVHSFMTVGQSEFVTYNGQDFDSNDVGMLLTVRRL